MRDDERVVLVLPLSFPPPERGVATSAKSEFSRLPRTRRGMFAVRKPSYLWDIKAGENLFGSPVREVILFLPISLEHIRGRSD